RTRRLGRPIAIPARPRAQRGGQTRRSANRLRSAHSTVAKPTRISGGSLTLGASAQGGRGAPNRRSAQKTGRPKPQTAGCRPREQALGDRSARFARRRAVFGTAGGTLADSATKVRGARALALRSGLGLALTCRGGSGVSPRQDAERSLAKAEGGRGT